MGWAELVYKMKLKSTVKRHFASWPLLHNCVDWSFRALRWPFLWVLFQIRITLQGRKVPHPLTTFWLNPQRVQFQTERKQALGQHPEERVFRLHTRYAGRVLEGDWDQSSLKVADLGFYRGFYQRMVLGLPWRETVFYQEIMSRIQQGEEIWFFRDEQDLDRRFTFIDEVIRDIRTRGYRKTFDKVWLNLSREGRYLFEDGRHRLSIAKILGLEKIPVQVLVRHELWQQFREELMALAQEEDPSGPRGQLPQPPSHPDLGDIPASLESAQWLGALEEHLSPAKGALLDAWARLGYFCQQLEARGFACQGLEAREAYLRAAEMIRKAEGGSWRLLPGCLSDSRLPRFLEPVRGGVVLALNPPWPRPIPEERWRRFGAHLAELEPREVFVGPDLFPGPKVNRRQEMPAEAVLSVLCGTSGLKDRGVIWQGKEGGTIHRLD